MSLLDILPPQGNILTLRLIMELKKKVALSEEEIEKFGVKQSRAEGGGVLVTWAPEYDKTRVGISISDLEKGVVTQQLTLLDQKGNLTINSLPLYDYFMDGKEPQET